MIVKIPNQNYFTMTILFRLFCLLVLVSTFGCSSSSDNKSTAAEDQKEDAAFKEFGATFVSNEVLSYEQLLSQIAAADSLEVTVKGKVEAVCQAKGCWMNIRGEQAGTEEMVVKFKDYGFFVPKDISGREVVMQGKAYREITPVDELRHLAEDAGKSAEEVATITEPKVELKFMANGVRLLGE